jgi:hypothetical protein
MRGFDYHEAMAPEIKWYAKAAAVIVATMGVVLGIPLLVGVWLPDVIAAPRNDLAEERNDNGGVVRVVQYWNRSDFYKHRTGVRGDERNLNGMHPGR